MRSERQHFCIQHSLIGAGFAAKKIFFVICASFSCRPVQSAAQGNMASNEMRGINTHKSLESAFYTLLHFTF